jgi:small-conductance mechanosensitive channel
MPSNAAKNPPECVEGPEAFQRFDAAVSKLLAVPRSVLMEREAAHRAQVDANPRRRGPKRKTEILAAEQQAALAKLEAEKQAIDNKIVDVQRELLKRAVGRRKRQTR